MNGVAYYAYLQNILVPGMNLGNGYSFNGWLLKPDGTKSLQFNISQNNRKSIPRNIIISARNAYNNQTNIDNNWLIQQGCNRGWCLVHVLNYLFQQYP